MQILRETDAFKPPPLQAHNDAKQNLFDVAPTVQHRWGAQDCFAIIVVVVAFSHLVLQCVELLRFFKFRERPRKGIEARGVRNHRICRRFQPLGTPMFRIVIIVLERGGGKVSNPLVFRNRRKCRHFEQLGSPKCITVTTFSLFKVVLSP